MHTQLKSKNCSKVSIILGLSVVFVSILWCNCADWPTRFERIDEQPRLVDFVFQNAADTTICEGAPGDSMYLTAYYSGAPIQSIHWRVSFDVYVSVYGDDTAKTIQSLDYVTRNVTPLGFSSVTSVISIAFKIPDNVLRNSPTVRDDLVKEASGMDRATLLTLIEQLVTLDSATLATDPQVQQIMPLISQAAPVLMQGLSVPIRLFATVNGVYKSRSDLSVRYNRFFKQITGVYVNHNPALRYIAVHKVKGGPREFLALKDGDTTYCINFDGSGSSAVLGRTVVVTDTVLIDTGYTYYVASDSGIIDTLASTETRDMARTFDGHEYLETLYSQLFYHQDPDEVGTISSNDQTIINSSGNFVDQLLPPLDTSITHINLWVQIYDYYLGELFRPYGSTTKETRINFKFTQGYKDYCAKNAGGTVRF
jgi:hypothetical protein